jgi:hypothetical protein
MVYLRPLRGLGTPYGSSFVTPYESKKTRYTGLSISMPKGGIVSDRLWAWPWAGIGSV